MIVNRNLTAERNAAAVHIPERSNQSRNRTFAAAGRSDKGDSMTGGGLHGKDLSKADVSVNIYAFLKAQETGR